MSLKTTKNKILHDCINCAYCVKHYGNLDGKFYLIGGCIHCVNSNLKLTESKKRINNIVKCEYWQPEQIQIDDRRKSIVQRLCKMAEQIDGIAQILEEDNKK